LKSIAIVAVTAAVSLGICATVTAVTAVTLTERLDLAEQYYFAENAYGELIITGYKKPEVEYIVTDVRISSKGDRVVTEESILRIPSEFEKKKRWSALRTGRFRGLRCKSEN
ncbi:MAG: hypothetical protein J5903_00430, partial [Clostridia bacterium]|nr:hypothetical protein [Clostridia bacterium]